MGLAEKSPKKGRRIFGVAIYSLGLLLGLLFNALGVWSDLEGMDFWGVDEAASFNATQPFDAKLNPVKCPLLLSSEETGTVTAAVTNPIETPIDVILQADISDPGEATEVRRDRQELQLGPGETREFTWIVTPEDRRYGRLILVRVYLFKRITQGPARTEHCGILVNDRLDLGSRQIIATLLAASLLAMAVGGRLWAVGYLPLKDRTRMRVMGLVFLSSTILAGMIANLTGFWIFAIALLVVTLLSLLAMFEDSLLSR